MGRWVRAHVVGGGEGGGGGRGVSRHSTQHCWQRQLVHWARKLATMAALMSPPCPSEVRCKMGHCPCRACSPLLLPPGGRRRAGRPTRRLAEGQVGGRGGKKGKGKAVAVIRGCARAPCACWLARTHACVCGWPRYVTRRRLSRQGQHGARGAPWQYGRSCRRAHCPRGWPCALAACPRIRGRI